MGIRLLLGGVISGVPLHSRVTTVGSDILLEVPEGRTLNVSPQRNGKCLR
jgi:hypothetical protein